MPTLATDIIGRVKRLPLKPSATSALLPMFEAISNGLHAIDDRLGDNALIKGRVDIEVLREKPQESSPPIGFIIKDNGIGLNEENYESFQKPDSRHKIQRGGKGVGRLGWLKVFQEIRVDSVYVDGAALSRRSFFFKLLDTEQLELLSDSSVMPKEPGTQVSLRHFESVFGSKCPVSPIVLRQRIIGHFLPLFAAKGAPNIFLTDVDGITDLRHAFDELGRVPIMG